jgi:S-adenosylmethionine-diacylgycerolhomoserine-N-methlytransferase
LKTARPFTAVFISWYEARNLNSLDSHGRRMDDVYKWTRHVYDLSRPFFLLGRNRLVDNLNPVSGATVLEMGCGTGHNLIRLAERRPDLQLIGVDASTAMLEVAERKIKRRGLEERIRLAHGYAESFRPQQPVAVVLFPYSLSMMPSPLDALQNANAMLEPDGAIHIVDFGDLQSWFKPLRSQVLKFLNRFEVYPQPEVIDNLKHMGYLLRRWHWGRYCYSAQLSSTPYSPSGTE